jgi:Kef-type K+ transport system membrane component KefB
MLVISWIIGTYLIKWPFYDTLFLGVALASSSTTIIAKVLGDMGKNSGDFFHYYVGHFSS